MYVRKALSREGEGEGKLESSNRNDHRRKLPYFECSLSGAVE